MKNLILIALLLAGSACFAQVGTDGLTIPIKDKKAGIYAMSMQVPKPLSANRYAQAKNWLTNHFKVNGRYTVLEDDHQKKLAGDGYFNVIYNKKPYKI